MAKGTKVGRFRSSSKFRSTPYPLSPSVDHQPDDLNHKKCSKQHEKKDWEDATCSVCMEYPHNAVLLLCSSYEKGCRPYMCGTSFRYSNCLDQYQKAHRNVTPSHHTLPLLDLSIDQCETVNLACPLCRGQVKGWTVVKHAREFLNAKKRGCMHDDCPFVGNYKATRKHVRADHPASKPREVDPVLEEKWRRIEREREMGDVISTITSSMPGAVVFGDYVIEQGSRYGFDSEDEDDEFDGDGDDMEEVEEENEDFGVGVDGNLMNVLLLLQAFGSSGNVDRNRDSGQHSRVSNVLDEGNGDDTSLVAAHLRSQSGFVLRDGGRSRRSRQRGDRGQ
ncbi:unnamed protein product [Cuscuta epithymum]|uniref:C2H2-type domain-containing protein n=1 Tax=Cuscuta epithymum TaxID=186058 RepID=A0AAV0F5F4_9ASTE|nr:unnamed protein product [Cuscuta epithymum]